MCGRRICAANGDCTEVREHCFGRVRRAVFANMKRLATPILATLLLLGACSGTRKARPAMEREPTVLEVDNRGFVDMNVYIVNGSQRIRLGMAGGLTRTNLTIPPRYLSSGRDLAFLADPIGGRRTAVSQSIYVREGDHVTLTIPP